MGAETTAEAAAGGRGTNDPQWTITGSAAATNLRGGVVLPLRVDRTPSSGGRDPGVGHHGRRFLWLEGTVVHAA
jgi:hypothetical protein